MFGGKTNIYTKILTCVSLDAYFLDIAVETKEV